MPTHSPTPAPTDQVNVLGGVGYATYIFAGLSTLLPVLALVFLLVFRKRPIIRMSQLAFTSSFTCGLLLIGASLIPNIQGTFDPSQVSCVVHDWLFNLGVVLSMSCLIVKEGRVLYVYNYTQKSQRTKRKFTDRHLFMIVGTLMVVPIILLATHTAIDPPMPDSQREWRCTNSPFSFALFGYEALMALAGLVLAILARKVPSVAGEGAGILYTALFAVFMLLFFGILMSLESSNDVTMTIDVGAFLLAFGVFWIIFVALGFIVFRKYYYIKYTKQELAGIFSGNSDPRNEAARRLYLEQVTSDQRSSTKPGPSDYFDKSSSRSDSKGSAGKQNAYGMDRPESPGNTARSGETTADAALEQRMQDAETFEHRKQEAEQRQSRSFMIGVTDGWREYVDRTMGDSFWVNEITYEITETPPTSRATTDTTQQIDFV